MNGLRYFRFLMARACALRSIAALLGGRQEQEEEASSENQESITENVPTSTRDVFKVVKIGL